MSTTTRAEGILDALATQHCPPARAGWGETCHALPMLFLQGAASAGHSRGPGQRRAGLRPRSRITRPGDLLGRQVALWANMGLCRSGRFFFIAPHWPT
jgi:hypothetical protein